MTLEDAINAVSKVVEPDTKGAVQVGSEWIEMTSSEKCDIEEVKYLMNQFSSEFFETPIGQTISEMDMESWYGLGDVLTVQLMYVASHFKSNDDGTGDLINELTSGDVPTLTRKKDPEMPITPCKSEAPEMLDFAQPSKPEGMTA